MIFFSAYLMGIFLEIFRFWEFWIGIVLEGLRGFDFFKRFTFRDAIRDARFGN